MEGPPPLFSVQLGVGDFRFPFNLVLALLRKFDQHLFTGIMSVSGRSMAVGIKEGGRSIASVSSDRFPRSITIPFNLP